MDYQSGGMRERRRNTGSNVSKWKFSRWKLYDMTFLNDHALVESARLSEIPREYVERSKTPLERKVLQTRQKMLV